MTLTMTYMNPENIGRGTTVESALSAAVTTESDCDNVEFWVFKRAEREYFYYK